MAWKFEIDPEQRILRSTFEGKVVFDDLLDHQRMGALLVQSLDPRGALIDLSGADPFDVTPDAIRRLAKMPPAMPQRERPRVVVAPSDHQFGMARIFQIEGRATRPNLSVVRTVEDAWAILGLDEAHFRRIS